MSSHARESDQAGLIIAGLFCTVAYGYLAWRSTGYGAASLGDWLVVLVFCSIVTFGVFWLYVVKGRDLSVFWLLAFALLFRLIGISGFPVLEDDFYRYLWDGRMVVEHGSPYGVAPAEFFADDAVTERFEDVLDGINYPEVATVYGPLSQWVFGLSYLIAPGQVFPLQVIFGLADILVLLILWRAASTGWFLLYAWSPLLVKEFAFSAHTDALGAVFIALALIAYQKRLAWRMGIALGLATGVKVFALVAAPFLVAWNWRAGMAMLITMILVGLPFGLKEAWLPGGLQAMGDEWLFNAPLYLMVAQLWGTGALTWFKYSLLSGFVLLWFWQYARWLRLNWSSTVTDMNRLPVVWLFGVFFLVLPVLNPWYLVWCLPFALTQPYLTPWVALVSLGLSYVTGINLPGDDYDLYQLPNLILVCEFAPIALAAVYDLRTRKILTAA